MCGACGRISKCKTCGKPLPGHTTRKYCDKFCYGIAQQKRVKVKYSRFKGTPTEYNSLHKWVYDQLGRPSICWHCGLIGDVNYQWANISGEYKKEKDDWARLCPDCHYKFDNKLLPREKDMFLQRVIQIKKLLLIPQ